MSLTDTELPDLSPEELRRYSRQMRLSELGVDGQEKLKKARILIVGVGGLGVPAAQYLAASGIGKLGLIDDDVVDVSNLHRQVLYGESTIGRSKIEVAYERLADLNPHIIINCYKESLNENNVLRIFRHYDMIIDGSDNFQTRYLINDACILTGIPDIYGSVFKFEGQLSVFGFNGGPCYRCLYPIPPQPDLVPNCADSGVLGALPGIIGTMQAAEALKIILGIGNSLSGRMLLFDMLSMKTDEIRLKRNPGCPVCGDLAEKKDITWIEMKDDEKKFAITVEEYFKMKENQADHFLLDVREKYEYDIANIGGELIPMHELQSQIHSLPRDKPIVVLCHTGIRSARMTSYLRTEGFDKVLNLTGGIDAWSRKIDSSVPRY